MHANDRIISDNEVRNLHEPHPSTGLRHSLENLTTNDSESRTVAVEDVWSSIFINEIDCDFEKTIDSSQKKMY